MDPDCLICFCPIEGLQFTCADTRCSTLTCLECTEALIDFSAKEKTLPKCPNKDCHSYYILSSLNGLSKESLQKYAQSSLDYFIKDQGDTVQKQLQELLILEQLRQERQKFIDTNFPAGIALVAGITFNSKLRRLEKQKSEILHKQMQQAYRACMNSTCGGFLDKNLVCMTCLSEFCRQCEKPLKTSVNHQCKQEDLDSVNIVNNMIKCPGCKLPVFKNEGCDSITCSNCGTKFLYSTGKEGGHGSSNAKIKVDIQQKYKLSYTLAQKIPSHCLEKILRLEALEPKTISKDTLLTPLKNYFKNINQSQIDPQFQAAVARQIAQKMDAYYRNRYFSREYQSLMVYLENLLKQEKLPDDFSDKLDESIKQIQKNMKVKVPTIPIDK